MTYRMTELLPQKLLLTLVVLSPAIIASRMSDERSLFERFVIGSIVMMMGMIAASYFVRRSGYPINRFYLVCVLACLMWVGGLTGIYFFG